MTTFGKAKHVHFVGIGGIGMSGIAELLINLGYEVSGSDIKESSVIQRLSHLGGKIYIRHAEENIKGADVVVYSSAISADNPEIVEAKEKFLTFATAILISLLVGIPSVPEVIVPLV